MLVGAIVRFATLDVQSFDHDEAATVNEVLRPGLIETLEETAQGERNPPGYYLLAWLWSQPFGESEVGLRSLSALFGVLTIPIAWLIGRESGSRAAGPILAALVALNPYLVWYSQEARSYELFVLASSGALLFFLRALDQPGRRALLLWAAFSALALLSHYFALFLILPQAGYLLYARRAEWSRVTAAVGAVGLVGLALAPLALGQQGEDRRDGFRQTPLAERTAETGLDFVAGDEPDPLAGSARTDAVQLTAAAVGLALSAFAVYLLLTRADPRQRRTATRIAVVAGVAAALPLLAAALGLADFVRPRNMIGVLVPALAVVAIGFAAPGMRRLGRLAAGLMASLFAAVLVAANASAEMQRLDWREVASQIERTAPDEPYLVVVPKSGDHPMSVYLDGFELQPGERGLRKRGVRVRTIYTVSVDPPVGAPRGFRPELEGRVPPLFELRRFDAAERRRVLPEDALGRTIIDQRDALIFVP